jgi:hypothetical protein
MDDVSLESGDWVVWWIWGLMVECVAWRRRAAPDGSGEEGHRQACSTRNRRRTAHISGDPGRQPVMTEVLLRSMSVASGHGRRSMNVDKHGQRVRIKVDEQGQRRRTEVGKYKQQ